VRKVIYMKAVILDAVGDKVSVADRDVLLRRVEHVGHPGPLKVTQVVIAYLMTKHNMSFDRALDFVKKSRTVRPNEGFVRQLKDLEFNLKRRR
jgi:hypothetical protein